MERFSVSGKVQFEQTFSVSRVLADDEQITSSPALEASEEYVPFLQACPLIRWNMKVPTPPFTSLGKSMQKLHNPGRK
jgi:hypothetical protein